MQVGACCVAHKYVGRGIRLTVTLRPRLGSARLGSAGAVGAPAHYNSRVKNVRLSIKRDGMRCDAIAARCGALGARVNEIVRH